MQSVPRLLTRAIYPNSIVPRGIRSISTANAQNTQTVVQMIDYGTPSVLRLANAPIPEPTGSQLLIQVHATSLNPLDSWMRQGYGRKIFETQRKLPVVLGRDCSGVVVGVGPQVGDEVFAATHPVNDGCFAQYVTVNENYAAKKPANISHREAASLPFVALTAWRALKDIAQVEEGQSVLILGASGAVGSVAIQLLKVFGCHVDGTCSPGNMERVRRLGADHVFDYSDPSHPPHREGGYDVILDCVGSPTPSTPREEEGETFEGLLKEGGRWVTLRGNFIRRTDERGPLLGMLEAAAELSANRLIRLRTHYDWALFRPNGKALGIIARMVEEGRVKAAVNERRFSLGEIVQAHQFWEQRHPWGKVVLEVPMGTIADPELIPLE